MRLLALALVALLGLAAPTAPAGAQDAGCAEDATVRWTLDLTGPEVIGARVTVPGCPDGETVGLQLVTETGMVPAEGWLTGELVGQEVSFDISAPRPTVAEVTGVAVSVVTSRTPPPPDEPEDPGDERGDRDHRGDRDGRGDRGEPDGERRAGPPLASTGASILGLLLVALLAIEGGRRLVRRSRSTRAS